MVLNEKISLALDNAGAGRCHRPIIANCQVLIRWRGNSPEHFSETNFYRTEALKGTTSDLFQV
jgi:hypothetical protein